MAGSQTWSNKPFFPIQVGVSVQGNLSCGETGGGVGLQAVNLTQICLLFDCIFSFIY